MSKIALLPCFKCGVELENVFPDITTNQPSEGTEFRTYGMYGSTFWDSFDGEELVLNVCDSCGVRSDDPAEIARVEASVGNAFVAMTFTNQASGLEWENDYCGRCWCRMQTAADGDAVPSRKPAPGFVCLCDLPGDLSGGKCPTHPVEIQWKGEMS